MPIMTDNLNKMIGLLENIFGWKYTEFSGSGIQERFQSHLLVGNYQNHVNG